MSSSKSDRDYINLSAIYFRFARLEGSSLPGNCFVERGLPGGMLWARDEAGNVNFL
jgi:hypothetical protein